ncbi:hypothetical protein [Clostridium tagluense]|uniref:hypothetical protein n=1 Tax=Clostridium tagluense TaxID=360422 RepID=UPI001C6E99F7|nr:hypothetical protein [Clostridium tagluense]MBW9158661.1 hypothetical protein [Clostridium tagluense]WLC68532.1 hypothetical protein KTC93_26175 [Clostridium tagluense]
MKKMKFADIFFLFLGTIGLLFGGTFGTTGYTVSAICIILSAIIFVDTRKKKEIL